MSKGSISKKKFRCLEKAKGKMRKKKKISNVSSNARISGRES
jgi:hypothetical protein